MAGTRSRYDQRGPESLALAALKWLWAALLALLFIVAGLALICAGAIFIIAGAQATLSPDDAGHAVAGALSTIFGLALIAAGAGSFWLMPRAVLKLSGSALGQAALRWLPVVGLSIVYYAASALLLAFGGAFAWNGLGPGSYPSFDHPIIGIAGAIMLVLGIAVFIFFPRLVLLLTGREVISTPYASMAGNAGGGGGGGGSC